MALLLLACTPRAGGGYYAPEDGAAGDAAVTRDDVGGGVDAVAPGADVVAGDDRVTPADRSGGCAPGSVRCVSATTLEVCSADGTSSSFVPCGAGTTCADGQCVAQACAAGARSCGPSGPRVCNAGGTGYDDAPCAERRNATARCEAAGNCAYQCADGFGDCDGSVGNGCETSVRDAENCGACGRRCGAGMMCMAGSCASTCGALAQCGAACVDLQTSVENCGSCGLVCPPRPNATPTCRAGACASVCVGTFGDCDGSAVTGCEADLQTSAAHCGACNRACAAGQACAAGTCTNVAAPRSCAEALAARPGSPSGVFRVDPDGSGSGAAFDVYCDMTTAGGGWTLVAAFTNADTQHWTPYSTYWTNATTLGAPTSVTTNADAKSAAYAAVPGDELMVLRGGTSPLLELRTNAGCLRSRTMQQVMSASSVYSTTCALSCTAAAQAGIFAATASCHAAGVRFRCRDDYTSTTANGFTISTDDNSFVTSMSNGTSCTANQSGLGAMSTTTYADVDADPTSAVSATDTAPRYMFVR